MRSVILTAIAVCAITMTIGLTADVQAAEIGNTVWNDRNKNRVQDPGEEGITDVRLKLYNGDDVEKDTTNIFVRVLPIGPLNKVSDELPYIAVKPTNLQPQWTHLTKFDGEQLGKKRADRERKKHR